MKIGDLVKVKHKYSNNGCGIGVILNAEEGFYKKVRKEIPPPFDHRLTIFWSHGETTHEPYAYVDLISETNNE